MSAILLAVTLLALGGVVVIVLAATVGSVAAGSVAFAYVFASAALINVRVARWLDASESDASSEDRDVDIG
jgi:hypothetical protein